ncbi:MAG TPA: hypothetical protein VNC40_09450 [Gaiellaceae bacterium]|nr:hypothetical protein [Gaiellaceae bacterium]
MKRTLIATGAVAFAGLALAATGIASASSAGAAKTTKVTIVMHDPGCHWFQVGKSLEKSLSVKGPVSLYNIDERAMIVKGLHGTTQDRVGGTINLSKGVYHITMVKQAPDDNHLTLTVR